MTGMSGVPLFTKLGYFIALLLFFSLISLSSGNDVARAGA
jgi:hypothetical protein